MNRSIQIQRIGTTDTSKRSKDELIDSFILHPAFEYGKSFQFEPGFSFA